MNDPTGLGNQILGGASTYTGGTTITKGTLSVTASGALGTGTVALNGGTLAFPAANLNGFSSYTVNGSAAVSGNTATLTNNNAHEAGSIFSSSKATLNLTTGFTATYTMNLNAVNTGYVADGIGFVLQNDPNGPNALGSGGGGLGWTGIQNTFIAGFETYGYDFGGGGANDVEFGTNGTFNQATTSGLALTSQSAQVTVSYDGSTITETIVGLGSGGTYTTTYPVNLASVLGSNLAYVGFTGGTGDGTATQTVTNFSMTNATISAAEIPNPIVANANTSSIIQVAVNSGSNAETFTSLTLFAGSKVTLTTATGSTGRLVFTTPSLSIASSAGSFTGQLDIGSNDLDLPGASLATITSMLKQGYANGTWNGKGIASNAAANDSTHLTALGVILNDNGSGTPLYGVNGTISSSFDGATPGDGDILVKYTYYGDANLDGAVDGSDYSLIDYAFITNLNAGSQKLTGWQNGDFNYDGVIDGSDYALIDNAFNQQGGSLGSNPLAQISAVVGGSAVPEPTSLGLLAAGAIGLLGRRRRCTK
jgi:autotransporter-associated beta strand protein